MKNCNNCKFINITEEKQTNKKEDHICIKHDTKLFHRSNMPKVEHNFVYPCGQCNGRDFIER